MCMGDVIYRFMHQLVICVKKIGPLSPTLVGLPLDELEQMINELVEQEDIKQISIEHMLMMFLLYVVDDLVLFANTLEDAQKSYL